MSTTPSALPSSDPVPSPPGDLSNTREHFTNSDRLRLFGGSALSYGAFWVIGRLFRLPMLENLSASLLQDGALLGMLAIGATFVACVLAATLIVGRFRFEGGLFCAAVGLIAIPTQGGAIANALLTAHGSASIYFVLAAELLLLSGVVYLGYLAQQRFSRRPAAEAPLDDPDTLRDRLTVVLVQALTTIILLLLIGQSPAKGQALVGVGVCGLLASLMTNQTYKVRGSLWYVAGTLLAGVVAYLYTGISGAPGAAIGEVRGWSAGAARSLPLHYASLGTAGAIYGYWISMVWIGQAADKKAAPASIRRIPPAASSTSHR